MTRLVQFAVGALLIASLAGCSSSTKPDAAPAAPLAETVWAQVEQNYPDGISSGSPLFAVVSVEDVSTGTIRVIVQDNLTDAQRTDVARQTFTMGALKNEALETVVVRDLSGKDSNHYR